MKCKICGTEFAEEAAAFCPACMAKLRAPGGGTGSFGRTPLPQPSTPSPAPVAAPPRASARQVWAHRGDLKWPLAVAAHPAGGVAVLDQPEGFRVLRLTPEGQDQGSLFSIPQGSGPGELDDPQGFCLTADGTLYVADAGNDCIAVWNSDGSFRQALGDLARPTDVQVDEDGFITVAESFRGRAQKLSAEGLSCLELTDAGGWGRLGEPIAVALDRGQNIYVADREREMVVQFSADGVPLRCWPGDKGRITFERVRDVKVGADGSIWIGDRDNTRVHRFAALGGLLGVLERPPEADLGFEGGTLGLLGDKVVIPDRLNDRVVCLTFER